MANNQPKVSVVLVTFNRADQLASVIESILSQTMVDFELIIADDASPDHTQRVCEEWALSDGRICYLRRAENVGMPRNLNLGIQASRGMYVAILHDDDKYSPVLLEKWTDCLDQHPQAAFVFNSYYTFDLNGRTCQFYREKLSKCVAGSVLLEEMLRRWRFDSPVWGTVMMRRSAFDHSGSFDERYGYWSDVDMWLRLAEDFDVCYLDEPLVGVASGEVSPHQFNDNDRIVQPLLERMFWEARMRHYGHRPVRRTAEAIRHLSFVAATRAWQYACAINRQVRLVRRPSATCR